MSVVVSVTGPPASSYAKASDRSCSTFCHASTVASLTLRAPAVDAVAAAKSCATESTAPASTAAATITSSSENPRALEKDRIATTRWKSASGGPRERGKTGVRISAGTS